MTVPNHSERIPENVAHMEALTADSVAKLAAMNSAFDRMADAAIRKHNAGFEKARREFQEAKR